MEKEVKKDQREEDGSMGEKRTRNHST